MADKRPSTPCRIPGPTSPTLAKSRKHPLEVSDDNARTYSEAQYVSSSTAKEIAAKMPCSSKGKIKLTTLKATTVSGGVPSHPGIKTSIPSPVVVLGRPRTAVEPPSEDRHLSGGNDFLSKESHL